MPLPLLLQLLLSWLFSGYFHSFSISLYLALYLSFLVCTRIFVIIIVSSFLVISYSQRHGNRAGIQFEWWFYAQSDFILSEVVLYSFSFYFNDHQYQCHGQQQHRHKQHKMSNSLHHHQTAHRTPENVYPVLWIRTHARQWFIWSQIASTNISLSFSLALDSNLRFVFFFSFAKFVWLDS